MAEGRKALHAYMSDEAHEHWHHAAQAWGVSVSGLLESISPFLDDIEAAFDGRDAAIVLTARRIDASRRRRRKA